jgi:hypothetical protein
MKDKTMKTRRRRTRPHPERTAPRRHWGTLFTAPDGEGAHHRAATDGPASFDDVLSRSVSVAYHVIDDYLRQGQAAAERMSAGTYGPAALVTDLQEAVIRMTRHASDFLEVGLQVLDLTARVGSGDAPPAPSTPPEQAPTGPSDPTRVRVELTASVPTEVTVDLRPEFARSSLVAHALRAVDPDLPPLTGVAIEPESDDGPLIVRIRIPDGHPAASYSGVVVEERTSRPAGTICVQLGAGDGRDGVA